MMAGRLRLRLFSHDEIVLMPGEVAQILRHRMMTGFSSLGLLVLIWLNWDERAPGLTLELHAPPQIGAVLAGALVPILALLRADRLARRGADVVVPASRWFLAAAALGFAAYNLLAIPLGIAPMPSLSHAVVDIAFNYVLAEIIGGLAVHFVAPRLLTELRRFAGPPVSAVPNGPRPADRMPVSPVSVTPKISSGPDTVPFAGAEGAEDAPPAPLQRPAQVRVANRLFDAGDIVLVQAEGTHVVLTTTRARQVLPGPFAAVVAQMPPELGQQISRGDWVATTAVQSLRRDGRDVLLQCRGGQTLRVAASRQAKLRDWFDLISAEQRHAAQ